MSRRTQKLAHGHRFGPWSWFAATVVAGILAIAPSGGAAAAPSPQSSQGYWLAAADGGVFSFGSARFHGSEVGAALAAPVVGIAATPDGGGYWLVAADGGVFAFGDARFQGSEAGAPLNGDVVGIAGTSDGAGYWLVGSDGGIFSFGDAPLYGSGVGKFANGYVVGITAPPAGGYVLAGSRGAVVAFSPPGEYPDHGGVNGQQLTKPLVGLSFARNGGGGYWLAAADGGVFALGDTAFDGSAAGVALAAPVVGIASVGQGPA